jgi:membrane associated rhomboid family serine protease
MFPLNDTEPNRYSKFPYMTVTIIVLNVVITGWEMYIYNKDPSQLRAIFNTFGTKPSLILAQQGAGWLSAITAIFLHGDPLHLIGNMFPLWVFGRRVEDACGSWRFLAFYLTCGVCADIVSVFIHYESSIPSIGASGAIFGLMGAYMLLFPGGRIRTVITLPYVLAFPKIRAIWIVLYFLALQIIPAYLVLVHDYEFYVGYWAHLGGFFTAAFILFFLRPQAFERYINGAPM